MVVVDTWLPPVPSVVLRMTEKEQPPNYTTADTCRFCKHSYRGFAEYKCAKYEVTVDEVSVCGDYEE